ncbi:hypothetical protein [Pseudomonas nitroreducens]|uniref:hypothetical protein n=1 Tax=Pseudomonas nitroreducens TaxID=46680 RepID=UPI002FE0F1F6
MSNIRNVQWNEGAPAELEAGMLLQNQRGEQILIGDCDVFGSPDRGFRDEEVDILASTTRWAWLIQPHELNWLEDMASRKTRTQE